MKNSLAVWVFLSFCMPLSPFSAPLALHPENPHYFLFRGKQTVLLTSGEHYGAVLNLDFDYVNYLDTLFRDGLNGTRTWAGAYCEPTTAFQIASNTLAPLSGRFVCPWARSTEPGYANGGNKFDLSKWDTAYFARLKDFLTQAGKRGIIVELNLFCPFYEESMWALSPMNASNNINSIGAIARTNVYTLDKNDGLLAVQDAMVRQLVRELKAFDNLYFEICNEPYFGGVTLEWQRHIAATIAQAESSLKTRHLISQNIANYKSKIENPDPAVSIFNFHYATPPDTIALNYKLNRVIGDNETGFRGTNDSQYRMEGWDFIVSGGGLFNNLDYSFTAGREDGTFVYPKTQPGGGSPTLRRQYGILKRLLQKVDFIHMHPYNEVLKADLPPGASARVLARNGEVYLVYIRTALDDWKKESNKVRFGNGEVTVGLELPTGKFAAEWLDPKTGVSVESSRFAHTGGLRNISAPAFDEDLALTVHRE
jgi:hypothetical protein